MKCIKLIIIIVLFIIPKCREGESLTESSDSFIEPEMIVINNNLKFTYGPSWDPTFPYLDSLLVVELKPYEIGKYELTNEEYEKFVVYNGYNNPAYWSEEGWKVKNKENWFFPLYWSENKMWLDDTYSNKKETPVHGISYYEAEAYCKWLSIKTGKRYYVPSIYQWMRAAKGPDPGTKYPWGMNYNVDLANYIPIGKKILLKGVSEYEKGKSFDGCYNMIGNAFEICLPKNHSDSVIYLPGYYSVAILSGLSTLEGDQFYKLITTICFDYLEKESRLYALGLRIVREN